MTLFNKHKYLVAVLLGLALGAALVIGGISAYNVIYPSNSARAGMQGATSVNTSVPETVLPTNIPDIVDRVSSAVVYIETTVESKSASDPFFDDPFFRQFFGNNFRVQPTPRVSKGVGSGFIFNA
ncbi:MAG: serine protease Do, partial [Thermoanaerobacteraceae bacterium]|nr:serine protease Do [Thermoanaerobacteraceae bacterium]